VIRSTSGPAGDGIAGRPAFGARTDVGRVRATNEDRFVARPPLFLVADGMGGQNGGEVAASITADLVEAGAADGTIRTVADLAQALGRANAAVWERAGADRDLEGMGTTCTAMLVAGPRLLLAHVGDSRAYLLRRGVLRQLTIDHTLIQRLLDEGRLRPEDAASHPQRSVIIRAIGAAADLTPDRVVMELEPEDRLLLCSDGLSGPVAEREIATTLATIPDPQAAAARLVGLANAAGGIDNVTAVVVDPDRMDQAGAEGLDGEPAGRRLRRRPAGRQIAVGALLLVLALVIVGLAAAAMFTSSIAPAATPTTPSATAPATPAVSPSPGSEPSPSPSVPSSPNLLPAPSSVTGTTTS
jgi:serine/threonine protein phosphatase PrpC